MLRTDALFGGATGIAAAHDRAIVVVRDQAGGTAWTIATAEVMP